MGRYDTHLKLSHELLEAARQVLSQSELDEIREWVGFNEYLDALDMAIAFLVRRKIQPTPEMMHLMEKLEATMELEPGYVRRELSTRTE